MTREELRRRLGERGLGRVADALVELAAPAIKIAIERADEATIPVGGSKVGGRPDLPARVGWPAWHEPMAFIAQYNLVEVASYDVEGALPDHGLLSFFYETNGEPLYSAMWGLPDRAPIRHLSPLEELESWRVLYHEGEPATFVRRDTPPEVNTAGRFPACAARFAHHLTLPYASGPEVWPLGLSKREQDALFELEAEVNRGPWETGQPEGHRLLGLPHNFEGPPLVSADAALNGAPAQEWAYASPERRRELEARASARWRLLFQVDSTDIADMDWAGGGLLFWSIEREALKRLDFSRVWLDMAFL